MIWMASYGHFLTQIPQPMHKTSEILETFDFASTSMHSLPMRTSGQERLHSWRHFEGLHLSSLTIAMRVSSSDLNSKEDQAALRRRQAGARLRTYMLASVQARMEGEKGRQ